MTRSIALHKTDNPQNIITFKGSLLLPMRLSTRLLVAHNSRELKKRSIPGVLKKYVIIALFRRRGAGEGRGPLKQINQGHILEK